MYTDLFLAILDDENPRGHPILAALLYAFCPTAAFWWMAGAEPEVPFDPVWRALEDLAAGETLKEALCRYGFENLMDEAKKYVSQIEIWRKRHEAVVAPELLPTFSGGQISMSLRFNHHNAIENLGREWSNFFAYIRAWAFVVPDWEEGFNFSQPAKISAQRLVLSLPGIRRPAYFPAWTWTNDGSDYVPSQVKPTSRVVVGQIMAGQQRDQLRMALLGKAQPPTEEPWPVLPEVWMLDPESGRSHHSEARLEEQDLTRVVEQLSDAAEWGPHPPLAALQGAAKCGQCGFHSLCYNQDGYISSEMLIRMAIHENP